MFLSGKRSKSGREDGGGMEGWRGWGGGWDLREREGRKDGREGETEGLEGGRCREQ